MPFSPLYAKYITHYSTIVAISWFIYLLSPLFFVIRFIDQNVFNLNIPINIEVSSVIVNNPNLLALLFIILFLGMIYFYPKNSQEKNKLVFRLILITALISEVVIMLLRNLELNHYPNFLYSKIGLPMEILNKKSEFDIYLILFIFILIKARQFTVLPAKKKRLLKKMGWLNFIQIASVILVIFGLFLHLTALPNELFYLVQNYNYKYYNYGLEYQYVQALSYSVPQNENIILPPKVYDWPLLSNQAAVRYFLFPRNLIGGEYLNSNLSAQKFTRAYFIEASSFRTQNRWPIINTKEKYIIYNYKNSILYKQLDIVSNLGAGKIYKITF